ncbi:MAG: hypothetical protein VXZ89_08050 [Candidatus Thermoplasmatota archaeon]|nr:hypothetical protein [Candidatus Thermoplasmatota archaeon]
MMPYTQHSLNDHNHNSTNNNSIFTVDEGYVQNFTESGNLTLSINWIPSNNSNISYTVIDNGIIRYSGIIEINDSISSYKIPIYHHIISPCTCVIEIKIHSDSNILVTERVLINAKNTMNYDGFKIVSISNNELISTQLFDLESAVIVPDSTHSFNVKSTIINEKLEGCVHGTIPESNVDIDNMSGVVKEYSITSIVNGKLNLQYDLSSFEDGWVSIYVGIGNGNNYTSRLGCISSKIDLRAPVITIDAPEQIDERIGLLIIDSSSTFDPHWGRDGLQYFWTYQQIDNPYSIPLTVQGDNTGVFTFDGSNSGTYQFNLTVIDTASHSSSQTIIINVINTRPQANMRIDSVPVTDGQVIRLTNEQSWNVDATYTYDTQNDIDDLTYTWFLDGEPIMSGIDRVLTRPENDNEKHELTLMVEDNDGAVDWVTVTIGIAGTPSDPDESSASTKIVATVSVFILMCTMLVFFIMASRNSKTPNIRQWTTPTDETTESRTQD